MPQLAAWDAHPEENRAHLKDRMKRLPRNGMKRVKDFFRLSREVPAAVWFIDFGDFVAVGDGMYLSSYLGPDEMEKVEGYEVLCWRNHKGDPKALKKCWRKRGVLRR
jgi:hypothetical protein